MEVSLGRGTQGRHPEDTRWRRARTLARFDRTQEEATSGLDEGENTREMFRDNGGKLVREVFGNCFSSSAFLEDPVIQQEHDWIQQSLSERSGVRSPSGWETVVPAKWDKMSGDIYRLPSFGKDAGGGQIVSFENPQARATNSWSRAVGDKAGKVIWDLWKRLTELGLHAMLWNMFSLKIFEYSRF